MMQTYYQRRGSTPRMRRATPQMPWSLTDLCVAYDWPAGATGDGPIGIVELGGGWLPGDNEMFFGKLNAPVPNIVDVDAGAAGNQPGLSDADGEVALDIQVAAGGYWLATGKVANIRMYWATDIASGVRAAARDGCATCSISWGASESVWGPEALDDMEAAAQEATAAGMIVFAASGDNDSSDGGGATAVDSPASCPHVIGCGGTKKTADDETVWNDNPGRADGEGTGGGFSAHFPVQPWQTGAPTPPAGLGRMVPDVSANADPTTGYNVVIAGQWQVIGGTSAVAPLYAGLFAALGARGFITPELFANPQAFTDIVEGENGVYQAAVGPDPCTGLGSMLGTKLEAGFATAQKITAKVIL